MLMFKKLRLAMSLMSLAGLGACAATPDLHPTGFMSLGEATRPPQGFIDLCRRDPAACPVDSASAPTIAAREGDAERTYWLARVRTIAPAFSASEIPAQSAVVVSAEAGVAPAGRGLARTGHPIKIGATKARSQKASLAKATPRPSGESIRPVPPRALAGQASVITPEQWSEITRINSRVNGAIAMRTDLSAFGVDDVWQSPGETAPRYGDCEDYVLQKRRDLIAAGISAETLSIALVTTPSGQSHAVLLIADAGGEYVLDNLSAWILPWSSTRYRWVARQTPGRPMDWVRPG